MLRCANCGAEQGRGGRFCSSCGVPFAPPAGVSVCTSCASMQAGAFKFCEACGAPPAPPTGFASGPGASPAAGCDVPAVRPAFGPARALGTVDRSWSARWNGGLRLPRLPLELIRSHPGLLWVPVAAVASITIAYLLAYMFSLFLAAALAVIFWLATAVFMAAVAATSQAVIVHRVSVAAVGA